MCVPVKLGSSTWMGDQPRSSPNAALRAFLWRLHQIGLICYHLHRQPLSPFWREGDRAETLSFRLWLGLPGDHPGAGGSPPMGTALEQTPLPPVKSRGSSELWARSRAESRAFPYFSIRPWGLNKSSLGDTIHITESPFHLHTILICSRTYETYTYV